MTDAHLILGRLDPDQFLGGLWRLEEVRTRERMGELARRRGFRSVQAFAEGILAVANATMERAIRVISVERGHDPREFSLVAFGGAGALHACDLAASLRIPRVLVPRFPGALSALGILRSDVIRDYSRTLLLPAATPNLGARLDSEFKALEKQARADLRGEGFPPRSQRIERQVDLRYTGQGYEITVPAGGNFRRAFHAAHERRYGYADPARPAEVVSVRLRAVGVTEKPALRRGRASPAGRKNAWLKRERVWFGGKARAADFFVRERLRPGQRLRGPAVVAEYSATTVIPPGWRARVDPFGSLLLERGKGEVDR